MVRFDLGEMDNHLSVSWGSCLILMGILEAHKIHKGLLSSAIMKKVVELSLDLFFFVK